MSATGDEFAGPVGGGVVGFGAKLDVFEFEFGDFVDALFYVVGENRFTFGFSPWLELHVMWEFGFFEFPASTEETDHEAFGGGAETRAVAVAGDEGLEMVRESVHHEFLAWVSLRGEVEGVFCHVIPGFGHDFDTMAPATSGDVVVEDEFVVGGEA